MVEKDSIALFHGKEIRKVWHHEEWWFAVEDVVYILTDSQDVKQYIKKLRTRDEQLKFNWGTICTPVVMDAKEMNQ